MFEPGGPSFWELARQALSSTERGYDLLAPKFERTPFRTPDAVLAPVARWLEQPVDAILDIGCGTGAAMRWLRPRCRRRVVGLDFSQGMLREAQRRLADAPGEADVALVRGDALAMPFNRIFDLAVCFGALGHFPGADGSRLAAQITRVLKPGGRFLFATGRRPRPGAKAYWLSHGFNLAMRARNLLIKPEFVMYYLTFTLPEAEGLLAAHGFRLEIVDGLFEEPWAGCQLAVAHLDG